eukprot:EG_transcript_11170
MSTSLPQCRSDSLDSPAARLEPLCREQLKLASSCADCADPTVLEDAAHFMQLAAASHGWVVTSPIFYHAKAGLRLGNLFRRQRSSRKAVLEHVAGLRGEDLLSSRWDASDDKPGWLVVRDRAHRSIVVALRGTQCTAALGCRGPTAYLDLDGEVGAVNGRMRPAAEFAWTSLRVPLSKALAANAGYRLTVVGHGQGAAVAVFFSLAVRRDCPELAPRCFAFAAPPLMARNLARRCRQYDIHSFCYLEDSTLRRTTSQLVRTISHQSVSPLHPPGVLYCIQPSSDRPTAGGAEIHCCEADDVPPGGLASPCASLPHRLERALAHAAASSPAKSDTSGSTCSSVGSVFG